MERLKSYALVLLLVVLATVVTLWQLSDASQRKRVLEADNEIARLVPFVRLSDSLALRVAVVSRDLAGEMAKSSTLRREIAKRDQRILSLVSLRTESKVETLRIAVESEISRAFFDTSNAWFDVGGWLDSSSVVIAQIAFRDSISVAISRAANNLFFGYVGNSSPYGSVLNAEFKLDASQFLEQPSPIWKWAAIGGWGIIAAKVIADFFR